MYVLKKSAFESSVRKDFETRDLKINKIEIVHKQWMGNAKFKESSEFSLCWKLLIKYKLSTTNQKPSVHGN